MVVREAVDPKDGSIIRIEDGVVVSWGEHPHTWKNFGDNNLAAVRDGHLSKRLLSTVADEIAQVLIGQYPWIMQSDTIAIEQYCRVEAVSRLLDERLWQGVEDGKDILSLPAFLFSELNKANIAAMRAADRLGLSPESRIKIAKDAGFAMHFGGDELTKLAEEGMRMRGTLVETTSE